MILGSLGTNLHDFCCSGEWKRQVFLAPLTTVKQLAADSRKQTVGRRELTVVRIARWTNSPAAGCPSQRGAGGSFGMLGASALASWGALGRSLLRFALILVGSREYTFIVVCVPWTTNTFCCYACFQVTFSDDFVS